MPSDAITINAAKIKRATIKRLRQRLDRLTTSRQRYTRRHMTSPRHVRCMIDALERAWPDAVGVTVSFVTHA